MDSQQVEETQLFTDYLQNLPNISRDYLLWRGCGQMPITLVRPHVVTLGNCVFVGGGNSGNMEDTRTVVKYDIVANKWSCLPTTAHYTFSMVAVKETLTLIGGYSVLTATASNELTSYEVNTHKWGVKLPAMPTKRCGTSAVSTRNHVVVVGGIADGEDANYLDLVEVLDLSSMVWSAACPFPKPVAFMSASVCSLTGDIFLLGGLSHGGAVRPVFSCSIKTLAASQDSVEEGNVWKAITDSPYCRCAGVAISGKLVVASGVCDSGEVTTAVHSYSPASGEWTLLGEMPSARTSCSIGVLPAGQILIVGGYFKPRNWIGSLSKDTMATVNLNTN